MESRTIDMERKPGKTTGILKYKIWKVMLKLRKAAMTSENAGYSVTHVTPKVTPDKNFYP